MSEPRFRWGVIPTGIYKGMLWLAILVAFIGGKFLIYYLALLFFLGVCLRPLLVVSGLYDWYETSANAVSDRYWRKRTEQRRREVEREERDSRYRGRRCRDPKLPKNW